MDLTSILALVIFTLTVAMVIIRPFQVNEAVPALTGALLALLAGIISVADIKAVINIVSGAAFTIIATFILSAVLDHIGFFKWAALRLAIKAQGSGKKLLFYVMLLAFLMTIFFNNDGSILITTPIIIQICKRIGLRSTYAMPYILSCALIATAASAPIGVSNISNIISMGILGINLNEYGKLMVFPSMAGIIVFALLLYWFFRKQIPLHYPAHKLGNPDKMVNDWWLFKFGVAWVIIVRLGFFIGASFGIPLHYTALFGAAVMLVVSAWRGSSQTMQIIMRSPWAILFFAFGMYLVVYSLKNAGLTTILGHSLSFAHSLGLFPLILFTGGLLTLLSAIMNNLPAIMIGTFMLKELNLPQPVLEATYLANVLGSDIGSLLTPIGTLASLIWFFLINNSGIKVTWSDYFRVTIRIVPVSMLISLVVLYYWSRIFTG